MATIYKRGKTWWLSYRSLGKNVAISLKTQNARVAEEARKQYEALDVMGLLPTPSRTPIGPLLQSLCDYWRSNRPSKSAENDIGRLRGIFGPCCDALKLRPHTPHAFKAKEYDAITTEDAKTGRYLPARKLEDLTPAAISRYLERRMVRDGIEGKTVNHLRSVLSSLFAYAMEYHGYRCPHPDYKNPIEGVKRFKEHPPVIEYLKEEDIAAQLSAVASDAMIRAMVAVYIYAGLRREEGVWLTMEDVDLEAKLIRVRNKDINGDHWQPKTKRNRVVPIGSKLLEELKTYLPNQRGTWFFSSPEGKRWDPDNFSDHLRDLNKAAGLSWSCLEFRHTFGSQLAQKGVSLFKISEMMGNSPEICRKHYAALVPHEMHAEVEF